MHPKSPLNIDFGVSARPGDPMWHRAILCGLGALQYPGFRRRRTPQPGRPLILQTNVDRQRFMGHRAQQMQPSGSGGDVECLCQVYAMSYIALSAPVSVAVAHTYCRFTRLRSATPFCLADELEADRAHAVHARSVHALDMRGGMCMYGGSRLHVCGNGLERPLGPLGHSFTFDHSRPLSTTFDHCRKNREWGGGS